MDTMEWLVNKTVLAFFSNGLLVVGCAMCHSGVALLIMERLERNWNVSPRMRKFALSGVPNATAGNKIRSGCLTPTFLGDQKSPFICIAHFKDAGAMCKVASVWWLVQVKMLMLLLTVHCS